jgi:methane/ammonia monooxygenase subunit B
VSVAVGYYATQIQVPQTIPLQTGLVKVKHIDNPSDGLLDIDIKEANYRIPGRSFSVEMTITNNTDREFRIGEFTTANVRFINSKVKAVKPQDSHDLVAADSLIVENNIIPAGETVVIKMRADDALWETQRLTSLVYDPDSFFAGLLFLYDENGNRLYKEISGLIIPTFV